MRCSDADTQLEALAFGHVLDAKISAHARRMQNISTTHESNNSLAPPVKARAIFLSIPPALPL